MKITSNHFGFTEDNKEVTEYILSNKSGASVHVLDFGLAIRRLYIKDKDRILRNVVLGYDDISEYETNAPYLGVVVGRYAGRLSGAAFTIDGSEYMLYKNDGSNTLHGGKTGLSRRLWNLEKKTESNDHVKLEFSYHSPHLEEGFPGNAEFRTVYTFNEKNELSIEYFAVSDRPTLVNLTNHSYFNFSKDHSKNISGHKIRIDSDSYIYSGDDLLALCESKAEGTPFDLRSFKSIAEGLYSDFDQIRKNNGYDHAFRLNCNMLDHLSAGLKFDDTGIEMSLYTTAEAVVLYTSNFLDDSLVLCDGIPSKQHLGVCLETQYFPNDINTDFIKTKTVLYPGEEYNKKTVYAFK